jgi:hypothetical protein
MRREIARWFRPTEFVQPPKQALRHHTAPDPPGSAPANAAPLVAPEITLSGGLEQHRTRYKKGTPEVPA